MVNNSQFYLYDKDFLFQLDHLKYRTLYAKIILLTWDEKPIEFIENRITTGSISIDGNSALQRSCSLTMPVSFDFQLNTYENHLNKKIQIEIGIQNTINNKYPDIIWFPQGIFILTGFTSAISNNSYNISIQAKDKMCLLNGDIGGALTADYIFDSKQDFVLVEQPKADEINLYYILKDEKFIPAEEFDVNQEYYIYETSIKYPIKDIIKNIVHELGKEAYQNILIEDIDDYGLDLIKYNGNVDLYYFYYKNDNSFTPGILKDDGTLIMDNNLLPISFFIGINTYITSEQSYLFSALENILDIQAQIQDIRTTTLYYKIKNLKDNSLLNFYSEQKEIWEYNNNFQNTYENDTKGDKISLVNLKNFQTCQNTLMDHINQEIQKINNDYLVTLENILEDSLLDPELRAETIKLKNNLLSLLENLSNIESPKIKIVDAIDKVINTLPSYELNTNQKEFIFDNFNYFLNNSANEPTILTIDNKDYTIVKIKSGNILGYRLNELIYVNNLTGQVGNSITSILDKIKQMLGDFEYFYDLNGKFVFRKTKLYLNNDWSQIVNSGEEPFTIPNNLDSSISYNFEDFSLITQINQTPQINTIKNDFAVWGKYTSVNNTSLPFHLRYAIDKKPVIYVAYPNENNGYCYISENAINEKTLLSNIAIELLQDKNYKIVDDNHIQYNDINFELKKCDWRELIFQMANDYFDYHHLDNFNTLLIKYNHTYCYNGLTGYEQYYTDIQGFWREIYNPDYKNQIRDKIKLLEEQEDGYDQEEMDSLLQDLEKYDDSGWSVLLLTDPTRVPFWLDFLDNQKLEKHSVKVLGDRQITSKKDTITALYYPNTPSILLYDPKKFNIEDYPWKSAYSVFKLGTDILEKDLITSGGHVDAFTELDNLLYKNLYCAESLTVTCIPILYLKPNSRIYLHNETIKLDGIYNLSKLTVPLSYNGTMQLTLTKMNTTFF